MVGGGRGVAEGDFLHVCVSDTTPKKQKSHLSYVVVFPLTNAQSSGRFRL